MNKERRKRIAAVMDKLEELHCELEEIMQEEEDALDNLPESLQKTERGEAMQSAIDTMCDVCNSIEEARDNLLELA